MIEDNSERFYPGTNFKALLRKKPPSLMKRLSKSAQIPDYLAETPIALLPNDLKENLLDHKRFALSLRASGGIVVVTGPDPSAVSSGILRNCMRLTHWERSNNIKIVTDGFLYSDVTVEMDRKWQDDFSLESYRESLLQPGYVLMDSFGSVEFWQSTFIEMIVLLRQQEAKYTILTASSVSSLLRTHEVIQDTLETGWFITLPDVPPPGKKLTR